MILWRKILVANLFEYNINNPISILQHLEFIVNTMPTRGGFSKVNWFNKNLLTKPSKNIKNKILLTVLLNDIYKRKN